MATNIIEDETFSEITIIQLPSGGTFENCKFINCNFADANFFKMSFMDCRFESCNLSLVHLSETGLQDIFFKDCKLNEVDFSRCLDFLFSVSFEDCILDNAIFHKKKNKGSRFVNCSMIETDLTEADLTDAQFINCNLHRASFSYTQLKNADLRTSYNYTINPDENNIKKARFGIHGLPGLLTKYDIRIEG
ncbi:pentapeptide repeat-containing protein [Mucilaginibacter limnophilus]|uniref:Pentapeptide repeat-containing protein n=1 Tax=Mucilaginibacter limnophilus TaxID=1932778 RepID=A0A437ML42_9SPHI|nr:pentapeptide repeat-containing protein [Mucilaginibacter limnophilus]RVT98380.1 pentapeptide repeat-containing protein [Mucilaginibacter limnophilus]